MSSTASELTALGATHAVDFYRRSIRPRRQRRATTCASPSCSRSCWGVLAVVLRGFASLLDNLIQAVNILGSLFYGTVLGMFLVAFFVRARARDARCSSRR